MRVPEGSARMVNAVTFPIFLSKDVVAADPGYSLAPGTCCILGYNSGLMVGSNLQIYSPFSIDTTELFETGYVGTLSHEMAEAVNDPTGMNPTPSWGQIGQVYQPSPNPPYACQDNLEVGDPLSPGGPPPETKPFPVGGYQLQELAFYSWFYGATPLGVGAGAKYFDNGTFSGFAKLCDPVLGGGAPN